MDKETYRQLDRIEAKIDYLITKLAPPVEEKEGE
jgi:hypothetical protein